MPKIDRLSNPTKDAAKLGRLAASSRDFRDAVTRASGVERGVRTNVLHWTGSSGSK